MPEPIETQAPAKVPKILVVDDDGACLAGLVRLLEIGGFDVTATADGRSALTLFQTGERFDAVLTDLMLPDVDGLAVARAARLLDDTTVVALATGDGHFKANTPANQALFDHIFLKPLVVSDVLKALRASLAARGSSS